MSWHTKPKDDAWKHFTLAHIASLNQRIWLRCNACGHEQIVEPLAFAAFHDLEQSTPLLSIASTIVGPARARVCDLGTGDVRSFCRLRPSSAVSRRCRSTQRGNGIRQMARFVCRCVSGDFKIGFAIVFAHFSGNRFKKIRLKRKSVLSYLPLVGRRRFRPRHIESVQLLSQVNSTSILPRTTAKDDD